MIDTNSVLGYAWPLIVSPGEEIAFHLSSATLTEAQATVVRVRLADPDPNGPGLKLTEPGAPADGTVMLRHQPIHPGSCAVVQDAPVLAGLHAFSVGCFLWPTRLEAGAQTVLARWHDDTQEGWRFGLDAEGRMELVIAGNGAVSRAVATLPLLEREWVFVGGVYDPEQGTLCVMQVSLDKQGGRDRTDATETEVMPALRAVAMGGSTPCPLTIAAHLGGPSEQTLAHFNGKIDRPRLYAAPLAANALRLLCERVAPSPGDPLLVAAWDFSVGMQTEIVHDRSANGLHGVLRQMPTRAMTGANWIGRTQSWTEAPQEYGAIHFHEDDMLDCGWSPDVRMTIPADWRSGFHALRLCATRPDGVAVESHVPFFLRAPLGQPRAKVAVVAATATFLAYANQALRLDQSHAESMLEGLMVLSLDDVYLQEHRELGLSTYDTHSDGGGWCYTSAARPILNMRPRGNTFNYVNDTHLLDWLEAQGIDYDVVTDEDIHHHGAQVLSPYACVITVSHPEYFSERMLNAFAAYQQAGGRHMYLGGNGFYWRIGWHPTRPHTMEIRRGMQGTRTWEGEPGENGLSFTGEPSGLWRANGRPPQRLVGVGFDAQVFDRSASYRRLPESHDPHAAFVFEGIGADETIGDFGLRGNGAAGLEIDRADARLGSPPSLLLLATADRIGYGGLPSPEEFRTTHRGLTGEQNANVRADMTLFPTANGGAVFTTGSIAWVCSLSHNGYENNVSRITGNVLRRFIDPTPIPSWPSPSRPEMTQILGT
jgi:N,N-dimethylformamidase